MKKILSTLVFSVIITGLFAQDFNVPTNYVLKSPADYAKYEADIIQCINWLMITPLNEQASKRKEANAFFMQWLTGAPNVSVDIKQEIVTFMQPNADLLMIFMGGWVKYALENKDYKNKFQSNLKGIESVIEFYQRNLNFLKRDKNVEKYIKMKEKGTLEDYITKNL
jgi:D-arabinose 1-dehydrogenase-like Zn-dependent alcohol dehydrogenase